MRLRQIGDTGVWVSALGLGTVKLGRNEGVKYPEQFVIPDDRQARDLLAKARELGINLLDTAPAYGNSEQRLGTLLKHQRHDWVICTKVGEEFEQGQSHYDFTPGHLRHSVERSLQRLQTDYLDLVLVHSNGDDETIIQQYGALDELAKLKEAGKIRGFGMSTKTVAGGILAAENSDCVMITYNLDYRDEVAVLDFCSRHGTGVLVKKALGSGHLNHKLDDPVRQNMRFIFAHPAVTSIVLGTINLKHLAENVAICNAELPE
jgi:aryl-alcohol dehydrogenase-like predicted oxidoreductase